jgi:putative membrane protein
MDEERDPVELSRRLVYLAAERTLTSWVRTALSLIALGFVIDRFGLVLELMRKGTEGADPGARMLSNWAGSLLIGLGALMALAAGIRYLRFALAYHREGRTGVRHGIFLGVIFSFLLALIGIGLIVFLTLLLE